MDDLSERLENSRLLLWLSLEVRRAPKAFLDARAGQDAHFAERGLSRSGPRVKLALRLMSEVSVSLLDASTEAAKTFDAEPHEVSAAAEIVKQFVSEMGANIRALAAYVGKQGSVQQAVSKELAGLLSDIEGGFYLAKSQRMRAAPVVAPTASITSDRLREWAIDAAARKVGIANARADARRVLGDAAPRESDCRDLLRRAMADQGQKVQRGRPVGSKSFANKGR